MSEPFAIWCTRWALSQGIEEASAWEFPGNAEWCVVASGRMRGNILQAGQWHRTKAAAVKEANAVLARAIRSQRDRLEELESIVFTNEGVDERPTEHA